MVEWTDISGVRGTTKKLQAYGGQSHGHQSDTCLTCCISNYEDRGIAILPYPSSQIKLPLGRIDVGLMEALEPPTTVEPFQPPFSSRPGPVCGSGVKGFQIDIAGKYNFSMISMTSDPFIDSSLSASASSRSTIQTSPLGRNDVSSMEVPKPPTAVEFFLPAFSSRPGPACGRGVRDFQPDLEGKFNTVMQSTILDSSIASSQFPTEPVRFCSDDVDHDMTTEPMLQICNDDEQGTGVSIYYQNVRGLRTKITDFYTSVTASLYDVVVLTETWLDEVIPSCMLFGNDYVVYRGDRTPLTSTKKRSGGTLIAVKRTIPSNLIPINDEGLEHVWVSLRMKRSSLAIGAAYIPPDKASDVQLTNRHITSMESVIPKHDAVAVFGDYNRPGLRWIRNVNHTCSVDVTSSSLTQSNAALLDGMSSNNMWQLNYIKNCYGNTLDLLFVREELLNGLTIEEVDDPLVPIDICHKPFSCTIENCEPSQNTFEDEFDINSLNFRKTDFIGLSQHLTLVDWAVVIECPTINEAVERFTTILQNAFAIFVPRRRSPKKPAWSNTELRRWKRRCSTAKRLYRKNRTAANKLAFQLASRQYRSLNCRLYKEHTASTEQNLKHNPKCFWNFVKSKRKETGLPSSMYLDQKRANTSLDKCELFASFF